MAAYYLLIKQQHLLTVFISILLFIVRFYWLRSGSPLLQRCWVRITPPVNDALFTAYQHAASGYLLLPVLAARKLADGEAFRHYYLHRLRFRGIESSPARQPHPLSLS